MSTSSEVVEIEINCHKAYEVRLIFITKMIGQVSDRTKWKYADGVFLLSIVFNESSSWKIPIDRLLLF